MIFNSKVYFKKGRPVMTVSFAVATEVDKELKDNFTDGEKFIDVGGSLFRKNQIDGVSIIKDSHVKESFDTERNAFYQEEKDIHARLLKLSPYDKAKMIDIFKETYRISMGEYPSEEILAQVKVVQEKFFIKNPTRTVCDPIEWKSLIPNRKGKVNGWVGGYFRALEKTIDRDMQLSNSLL